MSAMEEDKAFLLLLALPAIKTAVAQYTAHPDIGDKMLEKISNDTEAGNDIRLRKFLRAGDAIAKVPTAATVNILQEDDETYHELGQFLTAQTLSALKDFFRKASPRLIGYTMTVSVMFDKMDEVDM